MRITSLKLTDIKVQKRRLKLSKFNEVELTGPTKPSSEVLVKVLSLIGTPDDFTGIACNKTQHY